MGNRKKDVNLSLRNSGTIEMFWASNPPDNDAVLYTRLRWEYSTKHAINTMLINPLSADDEHYVKKNARAPRMTKIAS